MKTLLIDIETAPNLADVWGLWQQNVSLSQLRESSYMLCFSAKWHGDDVVEFFDARVKDMMLAAAWHFLNEADAVVTWNGDSFDLPIIRQELMLAGYVPPSPVKSIDLCKASKKVFRLPSNKLEYVAQTLGLGGKVKHSGHELWQRCMAGDAEAWAEMEEYNRKDTVLLEPLYDRLLPWLPTHPNIQLYREANADYFCTRCGSAGIQYRGFVTLLAGKYRRYVCKTCGSWSRGTKREETAGLVGV